MMIKNDALNYLHYAKSVIGVEFLEVPSEKKHFISRTAILNTEFSSSIDAENPLEKKNIFWRQKEGLSCIEPSTYLLIHQVQNLESSVFTSEYWETFKKMVESLGLSLESVSIFETNATDFRQIFQTLLNVHESLKLIFFLTHPLQNNNIYHLEKHWILETYSPLLFPLKPELKKIVWEDFKKFKAHL